MRAYHDITDSYKLSVVETRNVVTKLARCENLCFGGTTRRLQTPTTYYRRSRLWELEGHGVYGHVH